MRPFRFLHTADLHLGTPFRGIGGSIPETWMETLRQASFGVFSRIVDVAIQQQVAFVTIAGDLFDTDDAPMSVQFEFLRGLERLQAHQIPVFVCHGNHDPLSQPALIQWPDSVTVFPALSSTPREDYHAPSIVFSQGDETRIQISGFSYGQRELFRPITPYFRREQQVDFAIGLYHGVVGNAGGHANYGATTVQDLRARQFDFWGLGHIHQPQLIQRENPTILYPGNPQGRHARELGPRGVVLVDVSESGGIQTQWLYTSVIEWQDIAVDVDGCESLDAVRAAVMHQLRSVIRENPSPNPHGTVLESQAWIVRMRLIGQTSAHSALQDIEGFTIGIQDDLNYQRLPIWLERVELLTQPMLDVDALRQSDAFIGEFLRLVETTKLHPDIIRETIKPMLAEVYNTRNQLSIDSFTDEELVSMLESVTRLVLSELTEEGVQS